MLYWLGGGEPFSKLAPGDCHPACDQPEPVGSSGPDGLLTAHRLEPMLLAEKSSILDLGEKRGSPALARADLPSSSLRATAVACLHGGRLVKICS